MKTNLMLLSALLISTSATAAECHKLQGQQINDLAQELRASKVLSAEQATSLVEYVQHATSQASGNNFSCVSMANGGVPAMATVSSIILTRAKELPEGVAQLLIENDAEIRKAGGARD